MASTTKPLSGDDLANGSTGFTLADAQFLANAVRNLNTASSTYGITAAGTTQATATQLNSVLNQIDTAAASTGVNLPYSGGKHNTPYQFCLIIHNGVSDVTVYSAQGQTDTINGTAGSTGISQKAGSYVLYASAKVGAWFALGSGENANFGAITTTSIVNTGLITTAGVSDSANLTFTTVGNGIVQKIGTNGRAGTFVLTGTTAVTVSNTSIATTDVISISLGIVGGTVGAFPTIKTITAATGFTVAGSAGDTSTYNYAAQATAS